MGIHVRSIRGAQESFAADVALTTSGVVRKHSLQTISPKLQIECERQVQFPVIMETALFCSMARPLSIVAQSMSLPIFQIDAFADRPFTGNPAAVVFLDHGRESHWMQSVATEMNLSETAFVRELESNRFKLRWFTPLTEVDLCGHATLAAAHALWESDSVRNWSDVCFESRSGELNVKSVGTSIELDFPITPPDEAAAPKGLLESLHVDDHTIPVTYVGRSQFDYLIELTDSQQIRELQPDFPKLKQVDARGIIVTAQGTPECGYDFVSRFFGPAAGINEDPVTGSAHCCLADHWSRRLGKTRLVGYQASSRGGTVEIEVVGDRVLLRGQAVTVFRGTLEV